MSDAGKKIKEQYADKGGFTDLVFAAMSLLGYLFIPRVRDLASKRLHVFDRKSVPKELKGLIGDKIKESTIITNWLDILRAVATMVSGRMVPSQLMKKLASGSRQHDLAIALREIGRVERSIFIIEWMLDTDMQRRAQIDLKKGESHHALENAIRIGRQGEIRDRTAEAQHSRITGLNLLTAIIIYWNTKQLGKADNSAQKARLRCARISPATCLATRLGAYYSYRRIPMEENRNKILRALFNTNLHLNPSTARAGSGTIVSGLPVMTVRFTGTAGESNSGIFNVAVDGLPEGQMIRVQTGPAINGTELRDVVGDIGFGDFTNQIEYQNAGAGINRAMAAATLNDLDRDNLSGREISVMGAFTMINPKNWLVTPVVLEVK